MKGREEGSGGKGKESLGKGMRREGTTVGKGEGLRVGEGIGWKKGKG